MPVSLNKLMRFLSRIYAITFSNKILMAYFGILALARSATSLAVLLVPTWGTIPDRDLLTHVEIDPINFCGVIANLQSMWVPISIGIAFGM